MICVGAQIPFLGEVWGMYKQKKCFRRFYFEIIIFQHITFRFSRARYEHRLEVIVGSSSLQSFYFLEVRLSENKVPNRKLRRTHEPPQ